MPSSHRRTLRSLALAALLLGPAARAADDPKPESPPGRSQAFSSQDFRGQARALKDMKPGQRRELLQGLRSDYSKARSPQDKRAARDAVMRLSLFELRRTGVDRKASADDAAAGVFRFMSRTLSPDQTGATYHKGRDASSWHAADVLADGRTNGCVESVRVFQTLLRTARPDIQTRYLSSFDLGWARQARQDGDWSKARGHAMLEMTDPKTGRKSLLDPTQYAPGLFDEKDLGKTLRAQGIDRPGSGKVLQTGAEDLLLRRMPEGSYSLIRYRRGSVADPAMMLERPRIFESMEALQEAVARTRGPRSAADLRRSGAVRDWPEDGGYVMGGVPYVIFDSRGSCPFDHEQGKGGSSEATIRAAQEYLKKNP